MKIFFSELSIIKLQDFLDEPMKMIDHELNDRISGTVLTYDYWVRLSLEPMIKNP